MDYFGLKRIIEEGLFSPVYFFYGEEDYLLEDALKEIKSKIVDQRFADLNYYEFSGTKIDLSEILEIARELPLLGSKIMVVVRDAIWIEEGKKEELQLLTSYLGVYNPSSVLVFITRKAPSKRFTSAKEVLDKAKIVEFKPLKGTELNRWILSYLQKRGVKVEAAALDYLLTATGENLRLLVMEIEKLEAYLKEGEKLSLDTVKEVVGLRAPIIIFDLLDALMKKETGRVLFLTEQLLSTGEVPIRLNFMMARQFRLALTAKILELKGLSPKEIIEELKIRPFEARKILEQAKGFTVEELFSALERLLNLDFYLKTGGGEEALVQTFLELGLKEKKENGVKM